MSPWFVRILGEFFLSCLHLLSHLNQGAVAPANDIIPVNYTILAQITWTGQDPIL
jgi:hypothetical protein